MLIAPLALALAASSPPISADTATTAPQAVETAAASSTQTVIPWQDRPDQERYIAIMAALDAAAASRASISDLPAICPGELDNTGLDRILSESGYDGSPESLQPALRRIALERGDQSCDDTARSYDMSLLTGMSDAHLSIYLNQFSASLIRPADCTLPEGYEGDRILATRLAGAILEPSTETEPVISRLTAAVTKGCSARP